MASSSSSTVPLSLSLTDIEELESILAEVKNPQLKQRIEKDLRIWRSQLVTQMVNSSLKSSQQTSSTTPATPTPVVAPKPTTPAPKPQIPTKPTKKDEDQYLISQIKGFKEKVRSMRETLPEAKLDDIQEALIRCKGREDQAIEAVLSGELPKRPALPEAFFTEWKQKQEKAAKEAATPSTSSAAASSSAASSSSTSASSASFIVELREGDVGALTDRLQVLRAEVAKQKKEVEKVMKDVEKLKGSNLAKVDEGAVSQTRLYLPGEYEAIQVGEVRTFTFKPERTFSNEVSHIHFRVAESEFYRLLTTKNMYRVTEVKYIVSPQLLAKFEQKRAAIAFELNKDYKNIKPVLTYLPHKEADIEWIVYNNFKDKATGYHCTNDPSVASNHITQAKSFILCLCLPGKASIVNNVEVGTPKAGHHSVATSNGLNIKVFDKDQLLPYYIVKFEQPQQNPQQYNAQNPNGVKLLDEEWKTMESDAKADKFINDVQQFYQETLIKKEKERKFGEVNASDIWFQREYQKKYEKEKQFAIDGIDELASPTTFLVDDEEMNDSQELGTPTTPHSAISNKSQEVFEDIPEEDQ